MDPAAGGTRDICRQYGGDAGAILQRPLPRDAAPRHQPQWWLALRDPVLSWAKPRCGRGLRPDLRRSRQPAALRPDDLWRLQPASADIEFRAPPRRSRWRRRVTAGAGG